MPQPHAASVPSAGGASRERLLRNEPGPCRAQGGHSSGCGRRTAPAGSDPRSDDLLERLETANLGHFGALKNWSALEACRLTHDLVAAVNDRLLDVGLEARRLHNAREALEAVFEAQHIIFGHRHDSEEEEEEEEEEEDR